MPYFNHARRGPTWVGTYTTWAYHIVSQEWFLFGQSNLPAYRKRHSTDLSYVLTVSLQKSFQFAQHASTIFGDISKPPPRVGRISLEYSPVFSPWEIQRVKQKKVDSFVDFMEFFAILLSDTGSISTHMISDLWQFERSSAMLWGCLWHMTSCTEHIVSKTTFIKLTTIVAKINKCHETVAGQDKPSSLHLFSFPHKQKNIWRNGCATEE